MRTYSAVGMAILAFLLGSILSASFVSVSKSKDPVAQMLTQMKPGDTLVIEEKDITTPEASVGISKHIVATNKEDFSRIVSWFGLGGPEAAAKSQGLKVKDFGEDVNMGIHKGYGILEQLWNWIKSAFWVVIIGGVALFVLTLIPATAPFAWAAIRAIASIFPFIGSLVENILGKFKTSTLSTKLTEVVKSVQDYKKDANLTDDQKEAMNKTLMQAQSIDTQKTVQEIKAVNNL